MQVSIEQLAEEAMGLPAELRAKLADILVESLDVAALSDIDALWLDEAKRRRDDVRAGSVATIPGDEALRKVHDVLHAWTDPIVDEIHEIRRKMAEEAGYDLDKLVARLQESQKRHGDRVVTRPPRKLEK
ncbi:MAG: addiction module protein [Candidatus Hydrogenedentes bacterium]|nr:addiction module protein [Candidatus Hydrogenedentota bacterium]